MVAKIVSVLPLRPSGKRLYFPYPAIGYLIRLDLSGRVLRVGSPEPALFCYRIGQPIGTVVTTVRCTRDRDWRCCTQRRIGASYASKAWRRALPPLSSLCSRGWNTAWFE